MATLRTGRIGQGNINVEDLKRKRLLSNKSGQVVNVAMGLVKKGPTKVAVVEAKKKKTTLAKVPVLKTEVKPDLNIEVAAPVQKTEEKGLVELPAGVFDVDNYDANDPQMCAENVRSIYIYLRHLELKHSIKKDFLLGSAVHPSMRSLLVDWLIDVHQQFKLLQETLYLGVAILDRYLSQESLRVKRKNLQLIGVTSMFIAGKYEEMYTPEIGDFEYITDNSCKVADIRAMEIEILKALNFDLGRPLSLHFLRRYSKAGDVTASHHNFAKFALEAVLIDYSLAHVEPSRVAAASLLIALCLIDGVSLESAWNPNLVFYSGYDVQSLHSTCINMSKLLLSLPTSKLKTTFLKYTHKNRFAVALNIQSKYHDGLMTISNAREN